MSKIQKIETESPNNEYYILTPKNNLEIIEKYKRIPDIDLWTLYLKEEITFAELIIVQLLREYYNYTS
jgi:hypothetical protein